jgi:hypothetical protein
MFKYETYPALSEDLEPILESRQIEFYLPLP